MRRVNRWVLGLLVVLVLAGVWFGWTRWQARQEAAKQPELETAVVSRGTLQEVVTATGRVVPDFEVEIKAKASGRVIALPFDVSDRVKAGDLLARLDPIDESRAVQQNSAQLAALEHRTDQAVNELQVAARTLQTDLARAQADIQRAQARAEEARTRRQRLQELISQDYISKNEYDTGVSAAQQAEAELTAARVRLGELRTQQQALQGRRSAVAAASAEAQATRVGLLNAQRRLSETRIVSPISGVVTSRTAQIGTIVSSGISNVGGGTALMTVADLSKLYVIADVDESDIGKVALGQRVRVTVDAFPRETFIGHVERIAAQGVNEADVITFEVKIRMVNQPNVIRLKPEMTTNVTIETARAPQAVLVPSDAINQDEAGYYVQVVRPAAEKGKPPTVTVRRVMPGLTDGARTEIVDGLREGETVVLGEDVKSRWRKPEDAKGAGTGFGGQRNQRVMMRMGGGGGGR